MISTEYTTQTTKYYSLYIYWICENSNSFCVADNEKMTSWDLWDLLTAYTKIPSYFLMVPSVWQTFSADLDTRRNREPHQTHTSASLDSLLHDMYHCGRSIITLLTIINSIIFSLQAADCERKLSARPTAAEPRWDPIFQVACVIDEELRSFPWFLLVPR